MDHTILELIAAAVFGGVGTYIITRFIGTATRQDLITDKRCRDFRADIVESWQTLAKANRKDIEVIFERQAELRNKDLPIHYVLKLDYKDDIRELKDTIKDIQSKLIEVQLGVNRIVTNGKIT
jgi:hypothetical protein